MLSIFHRSPPKQADASSTFPFLFLATSASQGEEDNTTTIETMILPLASKAGQEGDLNIDLIGSEMPALIEGARTCGLLLRLPPWKLDGERKGRPAGGVRDHQRR